MIPLLIYIAAVICVDEKLNYRKSQGQKLNWRENEWSETTNLMIVGENYVVSFFVAVLGSFVSLQVHTPTK